MFRATFLLKFWHAIYKTDLKHAVTMPLHQGYYLTCIYSCIKFYCPTVRRSWIIEGVYLRCHLGRSEIFSFRCLVNFLSLFTWYKPKWNSLRVLFHCGHFDKNEISFRLIKYHVNTTRNEIIWKETFAHE